MTNMRFLGDWLEMETISNADSKCCCFDRRKADDGSRLFPLNTLTASPPSAQQVEMQMVWKSGEYGVGTDGSCKLAPAEGHGTWSPWHPSSSLHKPSRGERTERMNDREREREIERKETFSLPKWVYITTQCTSKQ